MSEQTITWTMPLERADILAAALCKLHTFINLAAPATLASETAYCLLADLRAQMQQQGVGDPYEGLPMTPRFPDTPIPAWPAVQVEKGCAA